MNTKVQSELHRIRDREICESQLRYLSFRLRRTASEKRFPMDDRNDDPSNAMQLSRCPRGVPPAPGRSPGNRMLRTLSTLDLLQAGLICVCLSRNALPRKEVIQPHLPVRLPCYDFTPLTLHTFDASPPRGWAGGFGCRRLGWCDGRCVQGPGTYSPRHADPRLLATPTSWRRVAASNPNWGRL